MSHADRSARASFRQHEVTRAVKAARAAGLNIAKVEIDLATGKVAILTQSDLPGGEDRTDLDRWITGHARKA